jgi:hypothetical protein
MRIATLLVSAALMGLPGCVNKDLAQMFLQQVTANAAADNPQVFIGWETRMGMLVDTKGVTAKADFQVTPRDEEPLFSSYPATRVTADNTPRIDALITVEAENPPDVFVGDEITLPVRFFGDLPTYANMRLAYDANLVEFVRTERYSDDVSPIDAIAYGNGTVHFSIEWYGDPGTPMLPGALVFRAVAPGKARFVWDGSKANVTGMTSDPVYGNLCGAEVQIR